jgi:hypothetical protein
MKGGEVVLPKYVHFHLTRSTHRFLVDVIIVQSGTTWHGQNFLRATLRQDFTRPRHGLLSLLGG